MSVSLVKDHAPQYVSLVKLNMPPIVDRGRPHLMGGTHADQEFWNQELASGDFTALHNFYEWCAANPRRNRRYV